MYVWYSARCQTISSFPFSQERIGCDSLDCPDIKKGGERGI